VSRAHDVYSREEDNAEDDAEDAGIEVVEVGDAEDDDLD
jgi:hypothetical protein